MIWPHALSECIRTRMYVSEPVCVLTHVWLFFTPLSRVEKAQSFIFCFPHKIEVSLLIIIMITASERFFFGCVYNIHRHWLKAFKKLSRAVLAFNVFIAIFENVIRWALTLHFHSFWQKEDENKRSIPNTAKYIQYTYSISIGPATSRGLKREIERSLFVKKNKHLACGV